MIPRFDRPNIHRSADLNERREGNVLAMDSARDTIEKTVGGGLGPMEDIEHTLHALTGLVYDSVALVMERPLPETGPAEAAKEGNTRRER
jgi:hypothetical protein